MELGYYPIGGNYGYYIDKAPQIILDELKIQIDKLQGNFNKGEKYNHVLIGEIEHEYAITPTSQIKQYIRDLTSKLEFHSEYITTNYNPPLTLTIGNDLWVNFQQKYEYNPLHDHAGIYSFVIWYKIPYTFENEAKYSHKPAEKKEYHGRFVFEVPNLFNRRENITPIKLDIDQSKEGYVAIFPSNLQHVVYPFYSSDEYRITVAGNVLNLHDGYR